MCVNAVAVTTPPATCASAAVVMILPVTIAAAVAIAVEMTALPLRMTTEAKAVGAEEDAVEAAMTPRQQSEHGLMLPGKRQVRSRACLFRARPDLRKPCL